VLRRLAGAMPALSKSRGGEVGGGLGRQPWQGVAREGTMTDRIKARTSQLSGGQPGSGRLGADQRAGSAPAPGGHATLRRRVGTQQAALHIGRSARASSGHTAVQRPAGIEQRAPRRAHHSGGAQAPCRNSGGVQRPGTSRGALGPLRGTQAPSRCTRAGLHSDTRPMQPAPCRPCQYGGYSGSLRGG
jgi:hypothetical protein